MRTLIEAVKSEELSGLFVLNEQSNQIQLDVYMPKVNQELLLTLELILNKQNLNH